MTTDPPLPPPPLAPPLHAAAARIEQFVKRVVAPAVYPRVSPLEAAVFQCAEPVPLGVALRAEYKPVRLGWRWGPVWSNAWFRLRGRVPAEMAGQEVFLRFSSGTEALLRASGEPRHGLDLHHDIAPVVRAARGAEDVELFVEAACNRPLGATTFFFDDAAEVARWQEDLPGRLDRCELVTIDRDVWDLRHTLLFGARLIRIMPASEHRSLEIAAGLLSIINRLPDSGIAAGAREAAPAARLALAPTGAFALTGRTRCLAVGHAHIDTAWLWIVRETRRKCLRTFSTALELMDRHPDFRFLCSQAQQYAWVEEDSPPLFARIRERVTEGRWEPGGAMWIEPDCNIPSGESLIRQILHGTRYWRERFGERGEQTYLYLPDTFGFPASLPQIIAQAGLRTFILNKLHWNDTCRFGKSTFLWRGIDGTEVLSHLTPGMEYNATNTPGELRKGDDNLMVDGWTGALEQLPGGERPLWLQPFGYGDGGGGPTDWMIHAARLASSCEGLPRVEMAGVAEFCRRLHEQLASIGRAGVPLPLWSGELYLERHRGTYTTQAWIKKANREAEEQLRTAEWLTFAGPSPPAESEWRRAIATLDGAWKLALLSQFHDILPGSSIGPVYADARAQYDRVRAACAGLSDDHKPRWVSSAPAGSAIVWNPCSSPRSAVVDHAGRPVLVRDVPAMGAAVARGHEPDRPVMVQEFTLANGLIEATIDPQGRVAHLRRNNAGDELGGAAGLPLNQLVLYDDTPQHWEAWDIDASYLDHAHPLIGLAEVRVVERGPLRALIETSRTLGRASRISQRYVLEAGSPRLDVQSLVDWHEDRMLLRALFPTSIGASRVTCGIQFGHVSRPARGTSPFAKARFEFCAHRWVDLSEPGLGLAVLSESKYGHSCRDGLLGLSLLRSTKFPDPDADMGEHRFTYSLMPHGGDWRKAAVDVEAEALNRPMWVEAGRAPAWPGGGDRWAPFTLTTAGRESRIEIAAIKPAEDGERLIVRLVESRGDRKRTLPATVTINWHIPVSSVESVDVAERARPSVMLRHDAAGATTVLKIRPFEIVSLAVRRA
jgi:alpha-mannosidase